MLNSFWRKYPAVFTVIPFAAGIVASYFSQSDLSFLPHWFFLVFLSVVLISVVIIYTKLNKGRVFLYAYLILLMVSGFAGLQYKYRLTESNNISSHINSTGSKVILKGSISERPEINNDRIRLVLDVLSVNDSDVSGTVLASVFKNKFKEDVKSPLAYGDIVTITGKLEQLPHRRNPGEFDYGEYLKLHDIDAVFIGYGFGQINVTSKSDVDFFKGRIIIPFKDYSIKIIDELIGGEEGEYLKGLVLGERSNISKEVKENFVNAGVAHIIAVSGLNVAYVIIIVLGVLIFVPIRYSYKITIILLFLFFYMNLTGNTPSIVRASIMASVFLLAQVIQRKPNSYNIVAFSALVILLIDPRQLFDPGFILSYTAILSIIIIFPVFESWAGHIKWYKKLDSGKLSGKIIKGITTLFLGTLAAQAGTLPITAIMFKKISIVSLIANLFAIPLSNIALALGFVTIIFSSFSLWLASFFAELNTFLLYWQLNLIAFCAKLDYSYIETYFVDWMLFFFYFIILILILTIKKNNVVSRIIISVLLIANFFLWKLVINKTGSTEFTYMDTGSANTTLISLPAGTNILIGAGTSGNSFTSSQRNIIPLLKSKGIYSLDLLLIQSLDPKEYISLVHLLRNFPVGRVIIPVYYKPIFDRSNRKNPGVFSDANIQYIESSQVINKKGGFRLYIYYDSLLSGPSMLTDFVYGSNHFLFADNRLEEESLCNSAFLNNIKGVNILRTPVSASFENTSVEFLAGTNPETIVLTTPRTGRKKKSSEIFSLALKSFGLNTYNIQESGAAIFRTNGTITSKVNW
jgi:competence protein ComEC